MDHPLFHTRPEKQQEVITRTEEEAAPSPFIMLYNDDVNTFDHVIESLMRYCDHEPEQAEQCAIIVHHVGRCPVKNGDYDKLVPICSALLDQGLSAKIEE
ncbi:MAG: ATP-dependent Clp protease adaptor ClpS [Bacteroidia bacterium]